MRHHLLGMCGLYLVACATTTSSGQRSSPPLPETSTAGSTPVSTAPAITAAQPEAAGSAESPRPEANPRQPDSGSAADAGDSRPDAAKAESRICLMATTENGYKREQVKPGLFWIQVDGGPKVEVRSDRGTWIAVADAGGPHEVVLFRQDRAIQKARVALRPGEVLGLAYGGGIGTYAYAPAGSGCAD